MHVRTALAAAFLIGLFSASAAEAACTGSNGRGWGSGRGDGKFEMAASDKSCRIGFPSFINDANKTSIPATEVTVTRTPKSGRVSVVAGRGLLYTPNNGFKGRDTFCTRNTTPKVRGKSLSGCITVTVR